MNSESPQTHSIIPEPSPQSITKISRPPRQDGTVQTVKEHLEETGAIAAAVHPLAEIAGKWHDLGKFDPTWQQYLQASMAGNKCKSPGHAIHGASLAWKKGLHGVAFAILGHHSGLHNLGGADGIQQKLKGDQHWQSIQAIAQKELGDNFFTCPSHNPEHRLTEDLLIRIIFSALVDADRESAARFLGDWDTVTLPTIEQLIPQFETHYHHLIQNAADTPINAIRRDIYRHCQAAATLKPGFFRLTTPTGGGKTLSVMAFALHHAQNYQQKRIIYCPPFTSIIEQAAQVYRESFSEDAVLEHHSGVVFDTHTDELHHYQFAAQRWDYPIIVSTTVQLFESLFSRHPSQCRKVHRITNSVIILDEVQALPTKYLTPIMSMLRGLVDNWNCSVVFCSATQPWYGILDLPEIRDIVPLNQRQSHAKTLQRVEYHYQSQAWDWHDLLQDIRQRSLKNALVVVSAKTDARQGFEVLSERGNTFHLSTNMYAAHRRRVLNQVRDRLNQDLPVYLISTQLIEAGVDIDFTAGYRAIAGLDSIIQTAGRVNRNHKSNHAILTIFELKNQGFPQQDRDKIQITRNLLKAGQSLHDEASCQDYFKSFLANPAVNLDQQEIQKRREGFMFKDIDTHFQMIEDNKVNVIIPLEDTAKQLIELAQKQQRLSQKEWRLLLHYAVGVTPKLADAYSQEIFPGLRVWQGDYNPNFGIVTE